MTYFAKVCINVKDGVTAAEVQRWLTDALIKGMQQQGKEGTLPLGSVTTPEIRENY